MRTDNLNPAFDRVLIEKLKEEKSEGGIYVPITVEDDNTYKAKVLAIGPDVPVNSMGIVGAIVVVGRYAGTELVKDSGVSIVNIKDILAIVNE